MTMTTADVAKRILRAYQTRIPIDPVRTDVSGLAAAYAVQRATYDAWVEAGRKPTGHKIGLTSKAVQEQLGVHEPDSGTLFANMFLERGAIIYPHQELQPLVEPEFAFLPKADLVGKNLTPDAVM